MSRPYILVNPRILGRLEQRLTLARQLPVPPNLLVEPVECKLDQRCCELVDPNVKFRVPQQARQLILPLVNSAYSSECYLELIGMLLGRLNKNGLGQSLDFMVSYLDSVPWINAYRWISESRYV